MQKPLLRLLRALTPLVMAGLVGCSSGKGEADAPDPSLPLYSPEEARLFDDVVAPAAFGFDPEARNPAQDPKLKERTRRAEFVVVARVETVSRVGGVAHKGAYEITVRPLGVPLVGEPLEGPIDLVIPSTTPSYAWVEGAGTQWVGSQMVVFGRHFREGNRTTLHFRGERDSLELRTMIQRDAGLRLLK
jgi:hypothetical protein